MVDEAGWRRRSLMVRLAPCGGAQGSAITPLTAQVVRSIAST
jgi:hypothetical protein